MHVFLRTDRMVLRRFTAADVDLLVELDSDPEVMQYITGGRPTPREEVERDVLPAFLGYHERFPGYGFWAAAEADTGDFLGWFHFRPREGSPPDEAELGYRLRRSAWGKGYATEGSRADPRRLHRVRGRARSRGDDGRPHRLPGGDGEGGPAAGAHLPSALAVPDRG